jgi:eukaryotic-like serine/threonine-protein kinase
VIAAIASGWFYFKPSPILTSKDTILLADIENKTGEDVFDGVLKQGLAIQLEQSPFLNLLPEAEMQQELKLMKRSPSERVTAQTAREICQRLNLKALITGSIAPFGTNYVITLEAINAQTGETFAREQAQAQGKEQVLNALSKTASELRHRIDQSLSSIQSFDREIHESTTANLEAFRAYSMGFNLAIRGQLNEAIPFIQQAVEIDPQFAQAQMTLALMLVFVDRQDQAVEVAKKAFTLKDRVGEIEKLRITSFYHQIVTGNVNKAIEVLKLQLGTYPRKYKGSIDLAFAYGQLGEWDQALTEAREAHRQNPKFAGAYTQLATALIRLNRFEEAKSVLVEARQHNLESPHHRPLLYEIAFTNRDVGGIQEYLDWARTNREEFRAFESQARAAAFSGNWRQAKELSRRAFEITAAHADTEEIAARFATEQALRGAALGDCQRSRADVADGLKLSRGRVSLTHAALALALCNETNRAEQLAGELAKLFPENTLVHSVWLPSIRAAIELHRGSAVRGIEVLRQATPYEAAAKFWPQYVRGLSYLKLQQGAEAQSEFQKIIDHRGEDPLSAMYPLAHLGSARAFALTRDTSKSRQTYEAFFDLWKRADSDLPVVKVARKEYEKLTP